MDHVLADASDDVVLPALRSVGEDRGLVTGLAPIGLAGFDLRLTCTWANPRFGDLVARPHADLPGRRWTELLPLTRAADLGRVREVLTRDAPGVDFLLVLRDVSTDLAAPQEVWRLHVYPLTELGEVVGVGVLAQDVTDDDQRLAALRREAEVDGLTGLLNRTTFHRRLADVAAAAPAGSPLLLLVVDLDGFTAVNDTYGHAVGDLVLAETGRRLGDVLATSASDAVVGRVGGDEFAVLARAPRGRRRLVADVRAALTRPVTVGPGCRIRPSVAIGHATLGSADGVAQALAVADASMDAVRRGRATAVVRLVPATAMDARQDRDIELVDPVLDRVCSVVGRRARCDERSALLLLSRHAVATGRSLLQVAADLDADLDHEGWEQVVAHDDRSVRPASSRRVVDLHGTDDQAPGAVESDADGLGTLVQLDGRPR